MQSTTAKLQQSFAKDPSAVLSALNEWLKEINIIEDHEEGTFEVLPRSTGNIAEGMLEIRIQEIGEAIRLAAPLNETVKLMDADELPKESDLESLWGWAFELRDKCQVVLEVVEATVSPNDRKYNMAGLKFIIDVCDNDTVRGYLVAAMLPVAKGRGKRLSYNHQQALQFAEQVIASPSVDRHAQAAKDWTKAQKIR
ncbi:MAG: hypothetical protein MK102_18920 [Fuerstiella sp.]|nr:hypothetical protein [Fuerstiella sp.]